MPQLVSIGGLIFGLVQLVQEFRMQGAGGIRPGWTRDVTIAMRMFAVMAVFLLLVMLGGICSQSRSSCRRSCSSSPEPNRGPRSSTDSCSLAALFVLPLLPGGPA